MFDEVAMLEVLATDPISNTDAYIDEIKSRSIKQQQLHISSINA